MPSHRANRHVVLFYVWTDAERAGRDSFVMYVNSIRPVNMVPVKSRGSAPAKKAGEASSVIKVCTCVFLYTECYVITVHKGLNTATDLSSVPF